ncbi:hypothetical protein [Rhizobium sp. SYY.PMSO]|uniref:phage major tropism determinant n=1 Tax=Rhizobium sp. SYY.PMSO TaxID=3382192 RepID=UPI00398FF214
MTAAAALNSSIRIEALNVDKPILIVADRDSVSIRAGTIVEIGDATHRFAEDTPVLLGTLEAGTDYAVMIDADGQPFAENVSQQNPLASGYLAGFHFAPGGHAQGIAGGDTTPAINPYSLWNIGFRPACTDPRGMAMVEFAHGRFWGDIYLLGTDHQQQGTSRYGATIADGRDLPMRPDGSGRYKKLDYAVAVEIAAHHGKRLLGAEEFFAASYGVKERCSRSTEPARTGMLDDEAQRFISKRGLFDATGTMWQWGTDGHPDDPRPSLFGGSWIVGSDAGSRYACLDCWAEYSIDSIGLRAASDHMRPA